MRYRERVRGVAGISHPKIGRGPFFVHGKDVFHSLVPTVDGAEVCCNFFFWTSGKLLQIVKVVLGVDISACGLSGMGPWVKYKYDMWSPLFSRVIDNIRSYLLKCDYYKRELSGLSENLNRH